MRSKKVIIPIVIILILLLIPFGMVDFLYKKAFAHRSSNQWHLYEYMLSAYPDLNREPIQFSSNNGQILRGYLYHYTEKTYDTYKGIIIMCHACGRGHDSYMQEIEYFARSGYLIMGYDNTGMNRSDGETLVGISQSPIDLHYAMLYVENTMELKNLPILLYGQSWGGYGVASVGKYAHDVKAIVSVAGFENNSGLIVHKGKQYIGSFMGSLHSFFYPYAQIYEWIIFGKDAGISGIKGFSKTKANVMLIHSKEDDFVSYDESFLKYKKEFKENPRFTFLSLTGHGHNGVLSSDINNNAENGLRRLDETIMKKVVLFYDDAI